MARSGVTALAHPVDGIEQRGQSLQRVILALHGNQDAIGGNQSIQCQDVERGGQSMIT
jgi:hypothetical protein